MSSKIMFRCMNCEMPLSKNKVMKHKCNIDNTSINGNGEVYKNNEPANSEVIEAKSSNIIKNNNQKILNQNKWNDVLIKILDNYDTTDEYLKCIINALKERKNVPRKEDKFHNFIESNFPNKHVPNFGKLLWDYISSHELFKVFIKKLHTDINDTLETMEQPSNKRLNADEQTICDELQVKKCKIGDSNENGNTKTEKLQIIGNKAERWNEAVTEILANYQTHNENLRIVINLLKTRTNIPQKEKKFRNYIGTIPESRKIEGCSKIIWEIISKIDVNQMNISEPQNENKTALDNESLQVNKDSNSTNDKSVLPLEKWKLINRNKWHENIIKILNDYHTDDVNLQNFINDFKTRKNIPQKFKKFSNYINGLPMNKLIDNCAEIIWKIISTDSNIEGQNGNKTIDLND